MAKTLVEMFGEPLLSDEIDWKKFNRWIRPVLIGMGYYCVEDIRPVIHVGEKQVRVLVRHHPQGKGSKSRESWVPIQRTTLLDMGVLKASVKS